MFYRLRSTAHWLRTVDIHSLRGVRYYAVATWRVLGHMVGRLRGELSSVDAAALTLTTLLAIVPLLALVMSIAKGFEFDDTLNAKLTDLLANMPEEVRKFGDDVRALVAKTSFGALGLIGSLLLAWSGLTLFVRFEEACNRIWHVRRGRHWYRRVTDFLALLILGPVLLLIALSLETALGAGMFEDTAVLGWLYRTGVEFVPYVVAAFAFAGIFRLIPAAHVEWRAALVGGTIAGCSVLLLYEFYLRAQIGVARTNAIYATFAAFPLLLIYLRLLWTAVLLGAEAAYAIQNFDQLAPSHAPAAQPLDRLRIGMLMVTRVCAGFRDGQPVSLADAIDGVDLPTSESEDVLEQLIDAGLLRSFDNDDALLPARPPEAITGRQVFEVLLGGTMSRVRSRLPDLLDQPLRSLEERTIHEFEVDFATVTRPAEGQTH